MAFATLENGLIEYRAGYGQTNDGEKCLIMSVEIADDGTEWVSILRLARIERVPLDSVVHFYAKEPCASPSS